MPGGPGLDDPSSGSVQRRHQVARLAALVLVLGAIGQGPSLKAAEAMAGPPPPPRLVTTAKISAALPKLDALATRIL
jgi:hypothetical protein